MGNQRQNKITHMTKYEKTIIRRTEIIDDIKNVTLVSSSDLKAKTGTKTERSKNVGIEIICENPAYVEMCKQILESLNKYEDMEPILVDDNSDGKTKNTFGYEIRKAISWENLNDAFNSIKYIVNPITQIDGDDFVSNPSWIK